MCSGPRAGRARTRGRFRIGFQCFSRPICFSRNSIPFSTRTYHQPFSPALCHSVQLPFASFSPPSNSGSEHRCHAFPTLFSMPVLPGCCRRVVRNDMRKEEPEGFDMLQKAAVDCADAAPSSTQGVRSIYWRQRLLQSVLDSRIRHSVAVLAILRLQKRRH